MPKTLGDFDGKEIIINRGRFGPYVRYEEKFVSIPRSEDPMKLSLERAVELIKERSKKMHRSRFYEGEPVTKGKGRFWTFLEV